MPIIQVTSPSSLCKNIVSAISVSIYGITAMSFMPSLPTEAESTWETNQLEEIVVTPSANSLAVGRPGRIINIISGDELKAAPIQSLQDALKLAASVDVRQRGPWGVQTDLNIDGGTHDQVAVLLNGMNISSPQVGHYSGDWPLNPEDIERIEILEGAGSRFLGGGALMGVINVVVKKPTTTSLTARAEGGSYGTATGAVSATLHSDNFNHRLSGAYTRSDGGTINSDFDRWQGYYHGGYTSRHLELNWQAGASDLSHGANTFYSAAYPDQHDHLTRILTSVRAKTKGRVSIEPIIYWHMLKDHYQLIRGTDFGENFHRTNVAGGRISASTIWAAGSTSIGSEIRYEHLVSSALGTPMDSADWIPVRGHSGAYYKKKVARTASNFYIEHNAHIGDFNISAGLIASMNTGRDHRYRIYPGIDVSYAPSEGWRFAASWSKSFRMPTFTDLYYKSVVLEGNKDIKPERMESWQITGQYTSGLGNVSIKGFYHHGHDLIDWVMYTADDIFHSTGFDLDNIGINISGMLNLQQLFGKHQPFETLSADYTKIHQTRHDDIEIYKSNYALEYLRNKLVINLQHRIVKSLTCNWSLRWMDRNGAYIVYEDAKSTGQLHDYTPYAVLDLKINYRIRNWNLHITANNVTNHKYYDFGNIPQPGLWIMAGATVNL